MKTMTTMKGSARITPHVFDAIPFGEFARDLRKRRGKSAILAARLVLRTAATGQELMAARWSHIDWEERTWLIPAAPARGRKGRAVKVSDSTLRILRALQRLAPGEGSARDGDAALLHEFQLAKWQLNAIGCDLQALRKEAVYRAVKRDPGSVAAREEAFGRAAASGPLPYELEEALERAANPLPERAARPCACSRGKAGPGGAARPPCDRRGPTISHFDPMGHAALMRGLRRLPSQELALIARLGLLTGVRRRAIERAKWRDVDVEARAWKIGLRRWAPLSDSALRVLRLLKGLALDAAPPCRGEAALGARHLVDVNAVSLSREFAHEALSAGVRCFDFRALAPEAQRRAQARDPASRTTSARRGARADHALAAAELAALGAVPSALADDVADDERGLAS